MIEKGQIVVELVVLVAVSMIILVVIFSIYSTQLGTLTSFDDIHQSRETVRQVSNAADSVFYNGKDSEIRILVKIPDAVILSDSNIIGKTVLLKMADGSDIIDISKVDINGNWKSEKNSYFMNLIFDGEIVQIVYKDFDVNNKSFFKLGVAPSTITHTFEVENISQQSLSFTTTSSFDHSLVTLAIDGPDTSFSLDPGQTQEIDLTFTIGGAASGNYAGKVVVLATGTETITEEIFVSIEAT